MWPVRRKEEPMSSLDFPSSEDARRDLAELIRLRRELWAAKQQLVETERAYRAVLRNRRSTASKRPWLGHEQPTPLDERLAGLQRQLEDLTARLATIDRAIQRAEHHVRKWGER